MQPFAPGRMLAVPTARTQHGDRWSPLSPDSLLVPVRTLTSEYGALGVCQVLFVFSVLTSQIVIAQCYYHSHFTDGETKIICPKSHSWQGQSWDLNPGSTAEEPGTSVADVPKLQPRSGLAYRMCNSSHKTRHTFIHWNSKS